MSKWGVATVVSELKVARKKFVYLKYASKEMLNIMPRTSHCFGVATVRCDSFCVSLLDKA